MNQPASDSSRRRVGPWFVSTLITQTRSLRLGVAVFLLTSICRGGEIPIADVQRSEPVMFEKDILPLLQRSCLACHSATEKQGDLILESPAAILKGGDSGPAIEAGKGAESLLLKVAAHQQEPVMPPADNDVNAPPLTSEELGLLRLWIDQGAKGTGRVTMLSPGKWQPVTPRFAPTLALSLTRDGQLLAASRGNQLDLYHVPSGQRVTRFSDPALSDAGSTQAPAHRDLIESLSFNTEGDLLASGGFREVKIWRRPRDVQRFQLAVGGPVSAVSTSLDGQWIATASGSQIRLWNAASGQPGPTLSGHTDKVSALRFSKDNTSLLSGSADHSIRRWQLPEGTLVGLIETPLPVLSLEVVDAQDPKTQPHADPLLVVGSTDNLLRTFRWPSAIPQKEDLNVSGDFRIQLSRDRKYAMVAESTGAIRILQADEKTTWKVLSEWKSDRIPVVAVDFVPSANNSEPPFVVVAAGDGSLTITPMAHFAPLRRWRGAPSPFTALTSAPDGRQFASGSESGLITLWRNSESDASKPWVDSGGVEVTAVQTHASRRILALAGLVDGKAVVSIRNLDNGQVTHTVQGHEGPVRSLAFSADGMRLLTGSDDQTVRIWDLSQSVASEIKKFGPLGSPVTALNATTDLARVIAGGADHRVHLWNVADGTLIREFGGHTARVMHVGLLADGQPYSVAADRTTRFWNPADGTQTRAWEMPAVPTAVAVTPDLQRLFAAGDDKGIRSFQLSSGQVLQTFSGHTVGPQALQLSSDLKRMVSLENTGSRTDAFLWDLESARLLEVDEGTTFSSFALVDGPQYRAVVVNATGQVTVRPWYFWKFAEGNQQPITALAFTKNSQQLLSTSRDGSLRGYQVETAQPLFSASHGAPVNGLAIAPNEQWMATAGENGSVRFWQMNGNAFGAQASGNLAPVRSVVVSLNSERVIASTSGDKPTIHMIDPATGFTVERVSVHHQAAQNLFALTEQGDFLSASPDSIQRWRSSAGRQFPGHNGAISSLAAIPQSVMQVVTGCTDSVIRRVNLSNGQVMAQFNHGGPVTGVAVRSDGQRVASVSENHTLKLWNINGQQVAELRGDIRRRTAVTRRTQQQTAANERVTRTRQLVESAEKDVPVKTEAAAKTSAALTAATMDLQQKSAALTTANEQKLAAENAS
ncbi:MAG: c-type cytochrome domain-containing protein, partial [Planctomycetota bacterium]